MPTTITTPKPPSSPSATPQAGSAGPPTDDDLVLVSDYEQFAWNQPFTLVEPLPAPEFLDLLNVIIERECDPEIRLRAIRMAAGVAEWCHDKYMRAFCGYDAPNGPPESEAASRDPHQIDRHLLLDSRIALEVGDSQFPRLAAGWLGIPSSVAQREAYFDIIESQQTVLKIVRKERPAEYLRAAVRGRVEDAARLRPQRARGQRVLSIHHQEYHAPVAECGIEVRAPFIDSVVGLLRAKPGARPARLASIIERVRDGYGSKAELGRADYQYLYDNVDMLARLITLTGANTVPAPVAARTSISTQPWLYHRIGGVLNVAHRYSGRELEAYGASVRSSLKNLEKSSADHDVLVAGK